MGGIHVSCGEFEGEDKSVSSIVAVAPNLLAGYNSETLKSLLIKLTPEVLFEEMDVQYSPLEVKILLPIFERYQDILANPDQEFSDPRDAAVFAAMKTQQSRPDVSNKWESLGAQCECVEEMLTAFRESLQSGENVSIFAL